MKHWCTFLLTLTLLSCWTRVAASCGDTQTQNGPETYEGNTCLTTFTKIVHWKVYWMDGYERDVDVKDTGSGSNIFGYCGGSCWPTFNAPAFQEVGNSAYWDQMTRSVGTAMATVPRPVPIPTGKGTRVVGQQPKRSVRRWRCFGTSRTTLAQLAHQPTPVTATH